MAQSLTAQTTSPLISSGLLRDILIGMSDGLIVPFALAAGLSSASVPGNIIVIAGIAAIAAGSITMSLGGYLSGKTEQHPYKSEISREYDEAEQSRHRELDETKEFFANMGLTPELQAMATAEISKDKDKWVDFMLKYELGPDKTNPKSATKSALHIGLSYIAGGMIPVSPYFFIAGSSEALIYSVMATLVCLFVLGYFKSKVTGTNSWAGAFRITLTGAIAAATAYGVAQLFVQS